MNRTLALCAVSSGIALALACATLVDDRPFDSDSARDAELALGELNCLACHAASDAVRSRVQSAEAPSLMGVGARVAPRYLRRFLDDPQATKSGTRMPDVLTSLTGRERTETVERLVHFLVSLGGPFDGADTPVYATELEEGRQLFHEVGCVQCHAPQQEAWELEYTFWELAEEDFEDDDEAPFRDTGVEAPADVPLGDLASKTNAGALSSFLLDPLSVRASGRMPSLGLAPGEAHDIAVYLLRDQAADTVMFFGLAYEYFEATFTEDVADFEALTPVRLAAAPTLMGLPEHREEQFGFRFRGFLRIDVPGEYTFFTTSDDGSRLWIDGALVVRNDGFHGMVESEGTVRLEAGQHTIAVTMFEGTGGNGLEVRWEGPGIDKGEIPTFRLTHLAASLRLPTADEPFEVDAGMAAGGRLLFGQLGCVACHETGDATVDRGPKPLAPDLDALHAGSSLGCLAPDPEDGLPRYAFGALRTDALGLAALVRDPLAFARDLPQEERITQLLSRFRCGVCHSRGGDAGPHPERRAYFYIKGDFDIGDEGRIPPALDEPGSKLRPEWLARVLYEGAGARPYMATRMPQFGAANLRELPALFTLVDGKPNDRVEPEFSLEAVENGRRVTGVRGLGCINCHTFAGNDSLGIPAVDLADIHERLQPDWFRRLLMDPIALNMNTRMPEFWVGGKSPVEGVCDGDPERQIDAMWTYYSLGHAMPLPDGLIVPDAEFELTPTDEPMTCGVFMRDVSPRTLVVGYPIQTHFAFDLQNSRLAKVWRGRFFNARGTWQGRAGALEDPPGDAAVDLPRGPAFALLDDPEADWPDGPGRETLRAVGRRFDDERRPSFLYALGDIMIEEQPIPEIVPWGTVIRRHLRVVAPRAIENLWFRGMEGRRHVELRAAADGAFVAEFEEIVRW